MFRIQAVSKGWMSLGSAWRWPFFWTFQRNYTFCWCIKYLRILAQNIGFTSTWDSWKGTIHKWRHKCFFTEFEPRRPSSTTIRDHSKRWVGGVRKCQSLLIYSTIHADVGGWVGLKKPKTCWRNTWMVFNKEPSFFWFGPFLEASAEIKK